MNCNKSLLDALFCPLSFLSVSIDYSRFFPILLFIMSKNRPVQLPHRVSAMILSSFLLFLSLAVSLLFPILSSVVFCRLSGLCLAGPASSSFAVGSRLECCLLLVDWLWRISDDLRVSLTGGRFTTSQRFKYRLVLFLRLSFCLLSSLLCCCFVWFDPVDAGIDLVILSGLLSERFYSGYHEDIRFLECAVHMAISAGMCSGSPECPGSAYPGPWN